MQIHNLNLGLFQNSKIFWEKRFVLDMPAPENNSPQAAVPPVEKADPIAKIEAAGQTAKQDADSLKQDIEGVAPEKKTPEKSSAEVKGEAKRITDKLKTELSGTVTGLTAEGVNKGKLLQVLNTQIGQEFQDTLDTQQFCLDVDTLIAHLKEDLAKNQKLDQDFDARADFDQILTETEKKTILDWLKDSLKMEKIPWAEDVHFSVDILNRLYNSVPQEKRGKSDEVKAFLKEQIGKKWTDQYKIVLEGEKQIVERMAVKPEEKELFKTLIPNIEKNLGETQDELTNILSRRFDISKNGEIYTLINPSNPKEKITDQDKIKQTITDYMKSIWIEPVAGKDNKEIDEARKTLSENVKKFDGNQADALAKMQEVIKQKMENNDEQEKSGFNLTDILKIIAALFQGNWEKLESLFMHIKLDEDTSKTNEFKLKLGKDEKIAPTQKQIFKALEGETVTIYEDKNNDKQGEKVKINDISQIGITEDDKKTFDSAKGTMQFTINKEKEAEKKANIRTI